LSSVNPPTRSAGILTLAPTIGVPPVPVTWPLMVVPCAWASAGVTPNTTLAIARKREILPVIPIHTSQKVKLGRDGSRIQEKIGYRFLAATMLVAPMPRR